MTIRLRLALLFSVATVALLLGGGTLFVERLQRGLENGLTQTLTTRADIVISRLAAQPAGVVGPGGRPTAVLSVRETYAQLLNPAGKVLASSRGIGDKALLNPRQARLASKGDLTFDSNVSVTRPGDSGPEPMRVLAKRIGNSNVLVVAESRDVVDAAVASARTELVLLGLAVLLLAGPGSWLLTRAALRPVERMRVEVAKLHARNSGIGLHVPTTHDEIARLAQTFNGLLERLHGALAREQAFIADAGHELRTPLTVLKGELELARRPGRTRDQLAGTVEVAAEETERLVRLTEDLLFLSAEDAIDNRSLPEPPATFDVVAVTETAVTAAASEAAARGVTVAVYANSPVTSQGNPDWIRRAVDNLLANALRHAPTKTTVTIEVTVDGPNACIRVNDQGPGFPAEFLPIAFDRFTRADNARTRTGSETPESSGNGLGLAIVRSIMSRHDGRVTASNAPSGGAQTMLLWRRTATSAEDLKPHRHAHDWTAGALPETHAAGVKDRRG